MILVVGGLNGWIGSNTTEALVKLGQDCVVTRHTDADVPRFLQKFIDDHRVIVESADATKLEDLRRIGEKHKIDGIVNVAGGFASGEGPLRGLQGYFDMLIGVFKVAHEWKVKRVTFSSTVGMYFGLQGTVNEEQPIILPSPFPILGYQKIVEVASGEFARKTGISSVCVRLSGMYGPFQDPTQYSLPQRLVHAAVSGKPPNLENVFLSNADDEEDLIYIKDLARAIALLQTAENLQYDVYNIGTGKITPNTDLVETIKKVVPNFTANLRPGRGPFSFPVVETKRLTADTGFSPKFSVQSGIRDYVDWLKAGNAK
jgi:UDP-glucose 4-epimerase